jgi:hypothetical protein
VRHCGTAGAVGGAYPHQYAGHDMPTEHVRMPTGHSSERELALAAHVEQSMVGSSHSNGGRRFLRNGRSNRHIVPLYGK